MIYNSPLLAMRLVVPATFCWTEAPVAVARFLMRVVTSLTLVRPLRAIR